MKQFQFVATEAPHLFSAGVISTDELADRSAARCQGRTRDGHGTRTTAGAESGGPHTLKKGCNHG